MAKPSTHRRLRWMLVPFPAMSWGPGCPSHPDRGWVWPPESMLASVGAPNPLLEALRKCTGDRGQVTDPEAAQQASGGISTLAGGWSPERGCTLWRSLRKGGSACPLQQLPFPAALAPHPPPSGIPEFLVCADTAAGLAGKRGRMGDSPTPHAPSALFGHSQCSLHCLTEQARCQPQNPALVAVCLSVCLSPSSSLWPERAGLRLAVTPLLPSGVHVC